MGYPVSKVQKIVYTSLGLTCVVLGAIGTVVPGLPTTPFILLASWLFYRSNERLRNWLLASRLGKYARNYEKNKGITIKGKITAIIMMLGMCTISAVFFIPVLWGKILVPCLGIIGSITVAFFVPTAQPRNWDEA